MEMMAKMENQIELRFNGADYQPSRDNPRLTKQILRVWECMKDSQWRTLSEIAAITGDPEASVSAQLRHLRKERFGGHTVDRRYLKDGLYQYKLTPSLNPMLLTNGEKATKARAGNE